MRQLLVFVFFVPLIIIGNPIRIEIINEFQTASSNSQRIEFRTFAIPGGDTIGTGEYLYNHTVITLAGTAVIDTNIYLPPLGYAIIDTSVLNGPFYLPFDSGYIRVGPGPMDSVTYPCSSFTYVHYIIPAPPSGASAAKFYRWLYNSLDYEYLPAEDWYIDYTPTLGYQNNDYPGCRLSGKVYGGGNPIANARVVAEYSSNMIICNPQPFYANCTTYTAINGAYVFDSLLPLGYKVTASASGYQSQIQFTPSALRCLKPITNFDFYLIGIEENNPAPAHSQFTVQPNPFHTITEIKCSIGNETKDMELNIYNITGRLVKKFVLPTSHFTLPTSITWDGTDNYGEPVRPGIYFAILQDKRIKVVRL